MHKAIAAAACTALLGMAMMTEAQAWGRSWSRGGSVTGPRGTTTWQRSGSCANGVCSRNRSATGPYGGSVSRGATCGGGTCTYGGTATGPRGNSATWGGSFGY
jgi:hypothetical protein